MAPRNRPLASCSAPLIYVSRTEIWCTSPQCGHLTFNVAFQAPCRLWTSVWMPVGACWCVVGQVKNREAICGSFLATGGSTISLSATGGDGSSLSQTVLWLRPVGDSSATLFARKVAFAGSCPYLEAIHLR